MDSGKFAKDRFCPMNKSKKECINCGACKKICPFSINVKNNYFNKILWKKEDF